jgi:NADP-dependent 3-hydroxy acid dehydrogenase YdfG
MSGDDRVLLITGASSGIGAATARHAAEAGWRVVLAARSQDKLDAVVGEIGEERASAVTCDVTSMDEQQAAVAAAVQRFGRLDAFFANAGFGGPRGFLKDDPEHMRSMVETNVLGCVFSIRAALEHFYAQNAGHVVLTGSVAGRRALPGSLYSATKWAVTAMGESVRAEVAETPIRTSVIEPGMVDTPFFDNRPDNALEPDDIARAVIYVLSQPPHVDVNEVLIRPVNQPS